MSSSAKRALRILEVVGGSENPLGVTGVARRLGIAPGTAFRSLDALQRLFYAERYQASSRYVLGAAALRLRQSLFTRFHIREVCLPYLRQIASTSGETASLTVPVGWYGIRIASARGSNEVTNAPPPGDVCLLAAHYTSRAILAFLPDAAQANYARWAASYTGVSEHPLHADLAGIREGGFACEPAGYREGHAALALPIRNARHAIAAIAIEGPVLDPAHAARDLAPWQDIARAIEAAVQTHPERFANPFGHIDPDAIDLDTGT